MEVKIYLMEYNKIQAKRENLEVAIQVLYENLNVDKEVSADEFNQVLNDEISDFLKRIEAKQKPGIIQILGEEFVKNNLNKGNLIVDGKKSPLKSFLDITNVKEDKIKIKMILNKNIHNKSYMFKDCVSLMNLSICDFEDTLESIEEDIIIDNEEESTDNTNSNKIIDDFFLVDENDIYGQSNEPTINISNISMYSFENSNVSTINSIKKDFKSQHYNSNLKSMFCNCISLGYLPDILSDWNTDEATDMNCLFYNCISLISLPDISKWNIQNVNDIGYMFMNCVLLKSLPDISRWNTINVNDMSFMFKNCLSLESFPDISKWNTSNATDMSFMFQDCILISKFA